MGHAEAARLLRQNLQQEERMAEDLEALEQQLGRELITQGPELVGHEIAGQASQTSAH